MTPTSTPRPQISPSEADRIQTHARSILEGEGQYEHDPALVEAVAREIYIALAGQPGCLINRDGAYRASRAALSTIRKHQAGE